MSSDSNVRFSDKVKYVLKIVNLRLRKIPYLNFLARIFASIYHSFFLKKFIRKWLKKTPNGIWFDFKGAKLPDISNDINAVKQLIAVFQDTFLVSCEYDDNYDKSLVERLDKNMIEGPYGYADGAFDVTIKKDDVVIDAGAWIGDFSAYAASKKAIAYAFEPVRDTFQILIKTAKLNEDRIYPVQKGLGEKDCDLLIYKASAVDMGSSIISHDIKNGTEETETITITTLDKFVQENSISRVDFIKADIEGAERDMLKGAAWVLKNFAPKLAICTYHLPDDPQVLEKLILEANPNYTIKHLRHKLFAMVVK
ncbi:MAG: FkbM family methyltransferase [Campylobacteraceae bacterium]|jgi:FkbM family methyltransferase|nr:FkbM family methyltransferase [Campylobacteraceae bacterium]